MNVIVTAYLVSAFICFESAIAIYRLNPAAKLNRLYTALAASFAVYSVVMIQFLMSPDEASCWLWFRIFTPVSCVFAILSVLYFLELTGVHSLTGNPRFVMALCALSLFFAIPSISFAPVAEGFTRIPMGWEIVIRKTPWALCFNAFIIAGYICCAVLAVRWRRNASTEREKMQARVIIYSGMGALLALLHLIFSSLYPGLLQSERIHLFNIAGLLLFVFGIRYATVKYRLMTLVPSNPASEFFAGMHDAIFITGTEGGIISMNAPAKKIAKQAGAAGGEKSIYGIFSSGESLRVQVSDIIAGRVLNQPLTMLPAGQASGAAALDVFLHGVKNEIGTLLGFMIIARENKGLAGVQGRFSLTNRELEVVLLLIDGLSAREISEECDISLLTVKTHIHNIYRKTGLRNRVEISNLLNKTT